MLDNQRWQRNDIPDGQPYDDATDVRSHYTIGHLPASRRGLRPAKQKKPCLSGCYQSTLPIESVNWGISAAPALRWIVNVSGPSFSWLTSIWWRRGFELRSEVCGDEDESFFFQAGMM